MTDSPLNITEYDYPLPDERIARFPLPQRDQSKLLLYGNGTIAEEKFSEIDRFIPQNSLLVFNNTRVIRARLVFYKESGPRIEIFCLQPVGGYGQTGGNTTWKCLIGNAKKWKSGTLSLTAEEQGEKVTLTALRGEPAGDAHFIHFSWDKPEMPFEQVLEAMGRIPLPPYLKREDEPSDAERYQTIYARFNGSVAAPTAGLHFTTEVLKNLEDKNCSFDYITLHVGAGTFKPVSEEDARNHQMHEEELIAGRGFLLRLLQNLENCVIPVGTTSMRSLESLYWLGVQIIHGKDPENGFYISQWEPYQQTVNIPAAEAIQAILDFLKLKNLSSISGFTGIMIVPGYSFRICKALITNFHQPQSTLLLLVAAFIGNDWKKVYQFALDQNFRFLSYGDSCFLMPQAGCHKK